MSADRVLIVGGGVIGLHCAYHLQKAGFAVTLVEQDRIGQACSKSNCGYICPSHILPLTEPGAVAVGIKSMFQPNAPFRIKPSFDPALWGWLLQFARRCRQEPMLRAGHALQSILAASAVGYRELMAEESLDVGWREDGLLYVMQTDDGMDDFARMDDLLAREFGLRAQRMNAAELVAFDAAFRPDLAGGFWYKDDASVIPGRLNQSVAALLREREVALMENCELKDFRIERGRITSVATSLGEMTADHYLLANGAWAAKWQNALGCRLPIQPGKGYSITMDRPSPSPAYPTLLPEHRVGITPMGYQLRLGSMMEFAGYDASIPKRRLALLRESANLYVKEPFDAPIQESWYGWRPMTYDSLPIIGPAPGLANLMLAVGHNMLGMTLAPATGRLVAELISGCDPHFDPAPFSPARFGA